MTPSEITAAIERDFPGWHAWTGDTGTFHAVTTENHLGGSGTTIEGRTARELRAAIAAQAREWAGAAA